MVSREGLAEALRRNSNPKPICKIEGICRFRCKNPNRREVRWTILINSSSLANDVAQSHDTKDESASFCAGDRTSLERMQDSVAAPTAPETRGCASVSGKFIASICLKHCRVGGCCASGGGRRRELGRGNG